MICQGKSYLQHQRDSQCNKQNVDQNIICLKREKNKVNKLGLHKKISQSSTQCSSDMEIEDYGVTLKRHYSEQVALDYSEQFWNRISFTPFDTDQCLKAHGISSNLRAKMIDWMIQVLSSYKMSEESFFKSVRLMDMYLTNQPEIQDSKKVHLIGIACMFMATKYEQIYPLRLSVLVDKVSRNKFLPQQIIDKESRIIKILNFNLEFPTVTETVKFIAHQLKSFISISFDEYFEKILIYLTKMCMFDQDLAAIDNSLLASAIYFIGLKTLEQTDKKLIPQQNLIKISSLVSISELLIINTSRSVLNLAKNYTKIYPQLLNLKKFNKFNSP